MVMHDHEHYINIYGYDCKSRHKNIIAVDVDVAYDNLQTGDLSLLLINQAIMISSMKNILLCPVSNTVSS